MTTEIITTTSEHFEWRIGEDKKPYKFKLSDKIITKQVKVTYDDNGKEISRENYIEQPLTKIDKVDIDSLTPAQIQKLKSKLGL